MIAQRGWVPLLPGVRRASRVMVWLVLVVGAFGLGAAVTARPRLVLLLLGFCVLALLVTKPAVAAVLAVATLPFPLDVLPGLGVTVAASDLFTVTAITGWALTALLRPGREAAPGVLDLPPRCVRPLALGLLAYAVTATTTAVLHPSGPALVTGVQRAELVLGGLLLGGGLVRAGRLGLAIEGYLAGASVLAAATFVQGGGETVLGIQKNPAGGFIVAGLLIALVLRPPRWFLYLPVLALGAVFAESRGALIGLAAGVGLTVLVVRYGGRSKALAGAGGVALLGYVAYLNLPSAARTRLLNTSGSSDYAIRYRQEFQTDALDTFRAHPWGGVGIGNYTGGPRQPGITDPHQVVYLQLAEGGVPLLVGFLLLCAVGIWACVRAARAVPLAVAALAVQVSTLTHALGDIYWVRGTPVLAYVLIGATLAVVGYRAQRDPRAGPWVEAQHRRRRGDEKVSARELQGASGG